MSMSEVRGSEVIECSGADANIIFGASIKPEIEDEIVITVVATGFDSEYYRAIQLENEREEAEADDEVESGLSTDKKEDEEKTESSTEDFVTENKANMWDAIKVDKEEEDLDIPPALRDRKRGRKKD